jgi:hypothetical protein
MKNTQIRKAASGAIRNGSLKNHSIAGGNQRTSAFNYKTGRHSGQCLGCKSDYMKFAHSGYCQDCQQRVEFIRRERPDVVNKAANRYQGVTI